MFRIGKPIDTESRLAVASGWRVEEVGNDYTWASGFFWRDKNVLKLDYGDGCTTLSIY